MAGSETLLQGSLFNKVACLPDGLKAFNSIKKRLYRSYFFVNFVKYFDKFFCRTLLKNHISHDVAFFPFMQISEVCNLKSVYLVEQW